MTRARLTGTTKLWTDTSGVAAVCIFSFQGPGVTARPYFSKIIHERGKKMIELCLVEAIICCTLAMGAGFVVLVNGSGKRHVYKAALDSIETVLVFGAALILITIICCDVLTLFTGFSL